MATSTIIDSFEGDENSNSLTLPATSSISQADTLNLDEDILARSVLNTGETSSRLSTHSNLSQFSRIASNSSLDSLMPTFEHIEYSDDANSDAVEPRVYDPEPAIQPPAASTASEEVNNGIPTSQLLTPNPSSDGHNAPVTANNRTEILTPPQSPPQNELLTPPGSDIESESRWSYQPTAGDWDDFTPDDYKIAPRSPPGSSQDNCLRHNAPAFAPSPPVEVAQSSPATCGCFDHDLLSSSTMHSARCLSHGSSKETDDQCRLPRNLEDGLKDHHLRRAHRLMKEAEEARQNAKEIRRRSKEDRREDSIAAKVAESMVEAVLDDPKEPTSQRATLGNWLKATLSGEVLETVCHLVDSNAQGPLSPYKLQSRGLRQRGFGAVNSEQRVSRFQNFFAGEATPFPATAFPPTLVGSAFDDESDDEEDDTASICSNPFEGHEPEPSEPYWIQWKAIPWTDFVPSDFPDGPHKGEYSAKAALRFMADQARKLRQLTPQCVDLPVQGNDALNEGPSNMAPQNYPKEGRATETLHRSTPRAPLQGHPEHTAPNKQHARRAPAVQTPTRARPEQAYSTPGIPTAVLRPYSVATTPPFSMPPSGPSQPTPNRRRPAAGRIRRPAPMMPSQLSHQRPETEDFSQDAAPPTGPPTRLPPSGPRADRVTTGQKRNREWR